MIRQLRLVQLTLVVVLAVPLLAGCGSDEGPAPAPPPGTTATSLSESSSTRSTGNSTQASPEVAKCTNLQVRECRVKLNAQGAIQNCFIGLQLCSNGVWGSCQEADAIEAQLNSQ